MKIAFANWGALKTRLARLGRKSTTRVSQSFAYINSELPDGHDAKIFKGRSVLLGDNVKGEESKWAIFSNLGSSAPALEACRALGAVSCLPGYVCKTSGAICAYCQNYINNGGGVETWVSLPEHRWPKEWIG